VLRLVCTVVPAAHGAPPQVQRPVGIAWRVWRWVSFRSSSWFSCAVSRLWKPDDFCLLPSLQTFELLYPVEALPLHA